MSIGSNWRAGGRPPTLEEHRRQQAEQPAAPAPARGSRLTELLGITSADAWRNDAACKGKPTEWWFPTRGVADMANPYTLLAHQICAGCPVKEPCGRYATEHNESGIWGNSSGKARARARRADPKLRRRSTVGPIGAAILAVLEDRHWHAYDELVDAVTHLIDDERAAKRYNTVRRHDGGGEIPLATMPKSGLRSGRRLITLDTVRSLASAGLLERGGGNARLAPVEAREVAS